MKTQLFGNCLHYCKMTSILLHHTCHSDCRDIWYE